MQQFLYFTYTRLFSLPDEVAIETTPAPDREQQEQFHTFRCSSISVLAPFILVESRKNEIITIDYLLKSEIFTDNVWQRPVYDIPQYQ